MTLDADVVRSRCTEIEESVVRLERIGQLSREQFLADRDSLDIGCYRLLVAIEAALALCYHVSAHRFRKAPEDYAACFGVLQEGGLLDADLAARLQRVARFRNLLVHVYWKLDYRLVYDVIRSDLSDLRQFAAVVAALL